MKKLRQGTFIVKLSEVVIDGNKVYWKFSDKAHYRKGKRRA